MQKTRPRQAKGFHALLYMFVQRDFTLPLPVYLLFYNLIDKYSIIFHRIFLMFYCTKSQLFI